MGTKMKGVLKGLRYITQIFEDEKEPEMQIGFPTDVKHVAHIGWDGPSVDNAPSWMKEYKSPQGGNNEEVAENPEVAWGSQDSIRSSSGPQNNSSSTRGGDLPDLPKSSMRHNSMTDGNSSASGSPKGNNSKSSKQSRRKSSDKSNRKQKDPGPGSSDSPSRLLPSLPKKSHRKKSKESSSNGGSSRSSRSKANNNNNPPHDSYSSPYLDPGPDSESQSGTNRMVHTSSLRPRVKEERQGVNEMRERD